MSASTDLVNAGPPVASSTGTRHALGVPDTYVAPNPVPGILGAAVPVLGAVAGAFSNTAPRYFTGDETVPFVEDDQGNRSYLTAPEDIAAMQNRMVAVGLIRPGQKFIHGRFDDVTQTAYKEILEQGNKNGMPWQKALATFQPGQLIGVDKNGRMVGVGDGSTGSTRAPFSPVLTPKEDLSTIYKQVAQKHLGRDPTPSEIDAFTKNYNTTELTRQQQAYGAQVSGGATQGVPNPSTAAEAQLTQTGTALGAESGAHNLSATFDNFLGLIRGPSASQA